MLAEFVLAAARRAERALGPDGAIAVVRAALDATEGRAQRSLLLAGLGAAARAGDASTFAAFAARWARSSGDVDARGVSLVARLANAGHEDLARVLARAELERDRAPAAIFALAALSDSAHASPLFEEVSRRDRLLADRARPITLAQGAIEALEAADAALAATHDSSDVLRLAPIALGSPRLYARVRALDRLLELAAEPRTQPSALRIALAHVDLRGAALGALERDRVGAIARRAGAGASTLDAIEGRGVSKLDEAAARDALAGITKNEDGPDRAMTLALRALAAVLCGDGTAPRLVSALAAHPPSPTAWTVVSSALVREPTRAAACDYLERWIDHGVAPPRGFTKLAAILDRIDRPAQAEQALTQATRANEPSARRRLGATLERRARAAYDAGDLRMAKTLIERSIAIDPEG